MKRCWVDFFGSLVSEEKHEFRQKKGFFVDEISIVLGVVESEVF
jgi:hypothetical protein